MKILLVIDQFDAANNGTTISAKRFANHLRSHGNEVRVISTGAQTENKYVVSEWRMPIGQGLIDAQGMAFAKPEVDVLENAVSWADVVHFMMPFALSIEGLKVCQKLGVPHTAAFHVQPENITSSIGLKDASLINKTIYIAFRDIFYNDFKHIHCPSHFIANQLKVNGYKAKLHVISNGVEPDFCYRRGESKRPEFEGKIVIMMIGRLSVEKRQDVLIDAVKKSKYADRIQLIFAGQGPLLEDLERRGADLKNPPIFRFFTKGELLDTLAQTDLYVHPADIEIEAISCIEAFATGIVPVIANSDRSATPQFALDRRSLFEPGNPEDCAKAIDYWLDNPEERLRMEPQYAEEGKEYSIEHSIELAEQMFLEAIADNDPTEERRTWRAKLEEEVSQLREKMADTREKIVDKREKIVDKIQEKL